ncbi:plantaricin C family lantibiotic [Apilactobacillus xinyiensis]|uniref:plantaricin C family lantibiotic n=1 Tax=Apilactobacillus xinyiensis TaxID=2841032 RepID=UPI002010B5FB|nr:plantaricin C family lantibiotic [Apilactobacillus xinyiensis]MCL0330814.1 plantaricin C family lantibiotic [Apilactobacillus xinyiensis]
MKKIVKVSDNVSGNVMEELTNAQLDSISGGKKKPKTNSSGDVCTLTSECDHLATWVCC